MDRYISFDWWWGGFNNIRMCYEMIGAMSYVSGRKIILPPKGYCLFLSEHNDKKTFFDIWELLDKEAFTSQFDCIEYEDSPLTKYSSDQQYYDGICKDIHCVMFNDKDINWGPQNFINKGLIYHHIEDQAHFDEFNCDNRDLFNINTDDEIIHFPRNLLGHFGYHVYPPNETAASVIKDKVMNGIKLRNDFETLSNELISGDYDSIHIRRNDFKYVHTSVVDEQYGNLLKFLDGRVRKSVPLYIATDEKDLSMFDFLKKEYDIKFLSDLKPNKDDTDLALDTLICSNSNTFLGSNFSTFSDYINIVRGYKGKKDTHRNGINYKRNNLNYNKYPWEVEPYEWHNLWGELYYGKI